MNNDQSRRRRRLAAFSLAPLDQLAEGLKRICPRPGHTFLRRPESGLVMVRGRIGNTGPAFNIGEMLVTRCTVQYRGLLGHGWTPGRTARQAELAALGDALGQAAEHAGAIDRLVEKLEKIKQNQEARQSAELEDSQVDFFTLLRGEDQND
ncbi:MAG: phosphonate C-P lyase system protein PhnG [Candidatus Adiutrix sp.]|jgi:alpha-D-ribose 1-methylphosphonate 5-triphosphate synthase subunit PhnG|nr:phosphonate C-P lyase system protein PhnG [Candidatus Adiutrix sp.]